MPRLHLVRHGETTSNVMRILDTALPGASLTDFGARQGVRFGLENRPDRGAVLYNSQAHRARQTADLIGSVWEVGAITIDGIHEVQVGDLEGRNDIDAHSVFAEVVGNWHRGDLDARLPGGESLAMLHDRYVPVLDELAARHLTDPDAPDVYVVSHGAAIRLVAAHLTGVDPEFALKNYLTNTGTVELDYTAGTWTCLRWAGKPWTPDTSPGPTPNTAPDPMG